VATAENRLYQPRNLTAAELHALVQPLLTQQFGAAELRPAPSAGNPQTAGQNPGPAATTLLVRDHATVLETLDRIVPQLDVAAPRLAVEALVLHVRFNEGRSAVDLGLLRERKQLVPARAAIGLVGADLVPPGRPTEAFGCGMLEGSLTNLLDTLDTLGTTNMTPGQKLTLLDGSQGLIALGDPRQEASETLVLRPRVFSDGSVRLEAASRNAPLATALVAADGSTVLLSGIRSEKTRNVAEATSFVDRLRGTSRGDRQVVDKFETLVVLNLHVVREPSPQAEAEAQRLAPPARKAIVERYFQAAQAAVAAGDTAHAVRLLDAALRLDPAARGAARVRDRLVLSAGRGG
jgi:hypothetical protein